MDMQTSAADSRKLGGDSVMNMGRMGLDDAQAALCMDFLAWQCRLRQMAMRHDGGRPSEGMRPSILLSDGTDVPAITVLINKSEPEQTTAQFRHMVLKTHDPADRLAGALRLLQAEYFQHPEEFSDVLSALFARDSAVGRALVEAGTCELRFAQFGQGFRFRSEVRLLDETHPIFQATYWHNRLFNSRMPGEVDVLAFLPDWSQASEESTEA